jgi:protein-tyrosine phosphatase
MKPFWIYAGDELRLAIVPRPRGNDWLEDEVRSLQQAGIDVLVSMLTTDEASELGLSDEGAACEQVGIAYRSFSIRDREVPSSYAVIKLFVDELRKELHAGKSVGVHCRASIGRSSLLLASVLCAEGWTSKQAFARISEARGLQVPDTPEQVRWVEGFAASLRPHQ